MNELKAEKKEFMKNVSWLFVAKTIPSAANVLEMIILARMLGLELFGLLTLVIAYVKIVNSLLDFRVWESVVKYVGEFMEKNETGHALSMIKFSYMVDAVMGIVAFLGCILLADFANDVFIKSPEGFELILIFSFSLLVATVNSTSQALFRVFDRFKTIVFVQLAKSILKLTSVVVVLYLGYGLRGVLVAYVAVSFFEFMLTQVMVDRILKGKGLHRWFFAKIGILSCRMREIIWFLVNTSFDATLSIAKEERISVLVLGYFFDSGAAGLYKIARSVIKVINRITDPLHEVIFPKLVSLSTSNLHERLVRIIKFSVRTLLKVLVPVLLVIFLFAEKFIGMVFGDQYVSASNTMRVLAIAVLFSGLTFWLHPLLLAVGRPGLRVAVSALKIIMYFVLLMLLVPKHSYLGAAVAYLIVEVVYFPVAIYLGRRFSSV